METLELFKIDVVDSLQKGFGAVVCLSPDAGTRVLVKGAGHKYVKRQQYIDSKGKKRYRYWYRHPKGGIVTKDSLHVGAAFRYGQDHPDEGGNRGHYHVKEVDKFGTDDHKEWEITLVHDETGREIVVNHDRLRDMIHGGEHDVGEEPKDKTERLMKDYNAALQYGTDKQIQNIRAHILQHVEAYGEYGAAGWHNLNKIDEEHLDWLAKKMAEDGKLSGKAKALQKKYNYPPEKGMKIAKDMVKIMIPDLEIHLINDGEFADFIEGDMFQKFRKEFEKNLQKHGVTTAMFKEETGYNGLYDWLAEHWVESKDDISDYVPGVPKLKKVVDAGLSVEAADDLQNVAQKLAVAILPLAKMGKTNKQVFENSGVKEAMAEFEDAIDTWGVPSDQVQEAFDVLSAHSFTLKVVHENWEEPKTLPAWVTAMGSDVEGGVFGEKEGKTHLPVFVLGLQGAIKVADITATSSTPPWKIEGIDKEFSSYEAAVEHVKKHVKEEGTSLVGDKDWGGKLKGNQLFKYSLKTDGTPDVAIHEDKVNHLVDVFESPALQGIFTTGVKLGKSLHDIENENAIKAIKKKIQDYTLQFHPDVGLSAFETKILQMYAQGLLEKEKEEKAAEKKAKKAKGIKEAKAKKKDLFNVIKFAAKKGDDVDVITSIVQTLPEWQKMVDAIFDNGLGSKEDMKEIFGPFEGAAEWLEGVAKHAKKKHQMSIDTAKVFLDKVEEYILKEAEFVPKSGMVANVLSLGDWEELLDYIKMEDIDLDQLIPEGAHAWIESLYDKATKEKEPGGWEGAEGGPGGEGGDKITPAVTKQWQKVKKLIDDEITTGMGQTTAFTQINTSPEWQEFLQEFNSAGLDSSHVSQVLGEDSLWNYLEKKVAGQEPGAPPSPSIPHIQKGKEQFQKVKDLMGQWADDEEMTPDELWDKVHESDQWDELINSALDAVDADPSKGMDQAITEMLGGKALIDICKDVVSKSKVGKTPFTITGKTKWAKVKIPGAQNAWAIHAKDPNYPGKHEAHRHTVLMGYVAKKKNGKWGCAGDDTEFDKQGDALKHLKKQLKTEEVKVGEKFAGLPGIKVVHGAITKKKLPDGGYEIHAPAKYGGLEIKSYVGHVKKVTSFWGDKWTVYDQNGDQITETGTWDGKFHKMQGAADFLHGHAINKQKEEREEAFLQMTPAEKMVQYTNKFLSSLSGGTDDDISEAFFKLREHSKKHTSDAYHNGEEITKQWLYGKIMEAHVNGTLHNASGWANWAEEKATTGHGTKPALPAKYQTTTSSYSSPGNYSMPSTAVSALNPPKAHEQPLALQAHVASTKARNEAVMKKLGLDKMSPTNSSARMDKLQQLMPDAHSRIKGGLSSFVSSSKPKLYGGELSPNAYPRLIAIGLGMTTAEQEMEIMWNMWPSSGGPDEDMMKEFEKVAKRYENPAPGSKEEKDVEYAAAVQQIFIDKIRANPPKNYVKASEPGGQDYMLFYRGQSNAPAGWHEDFDDGNFHQSSFASWSDEKSTAKGFATSPGLGGGYATKPLINGWVFEAAVPLEYCWTGHHATTGFLYGEKETTVMKFDDGAFHKKATLVAGTKGKDLKTEGHK